MEFPVKSATYAMKGKQILGKNGIRSYVGKRNDEKGCHYYLNVAEKYSGIAKTILGKNGILS